MYEAACNKVDQDLPIQHLNRLLESKTSSSFKHHTYLYSGGQWLLPLGLLVSPSGVY